MSKGGNRIFFEVTDIVDYAIRNHRVSGIQRVQLNLIRRISKNHQSSSIYCIFFHPILGKNVSFLPKDAFGDAEFDASLLLYQLGLELESFFPSKIEVRRYLNQYSESKITRALKKIQVYAYSIFSPQRLSAMGIELLKARYHAYSKTPLVNTEITPRDTLVVLGSNWTFKNVVSFCKAHAEKGGNVVQMIYDLIPYSHQEYVPSDLRVNFSRWLHDISGYVSRYICISRFTEGELRSFLGPQADHKQIVTIPLAHEFDGYQRDCAAVAAHPSIASAMQHPYVLCVGTVEIRKNGAALLKAWAELHRLMGDSTPRLIFAGKRGWSISSFFDILEKNPQLSSFVHLIESPSDTDLVALYQSCLFTIYPSLCEGWGLPVGESVWFGKVCLASTLTSVPEVCGDWIDYVDPREVHDIVAKVHAMVSDPADIRRKEKILQGHVMRTWDDVSEDIAKFIMNGTVVPAQVPALAEAGPVRRFA